MNVLEQIGKDLSHQAVTRKILFSMPKECRCNHYQYRKSSIKPPRGAYFFSSTFEGGLIEGGGLKRERGAYLI